MRKSSVLLISFFFLIILSAFIFSVFYYKIEGKMAEDALNNVKQKPLYHFVLIAQNTDDPFWQSIWKGANDAANEMNVAVEFNGPKFTNLSEELQYLDIAIASNVDGIATHVLDEEKFTPVIDKAIDMKIPVITIESDAKKSKRMSYIGTNNFQLGSEGGKLVARATGGKAKVAVVLNSYGNDDKGDVAQNLRIAGFKDATRDFQQDIEIVTIKTSRMGIFSAGEVTNEIINSFPDVNAIFCTNAKDTVGAAQVIVDLNKVGSVNIVGFGDLPEIRRYVDKGVIYGTVVSNPVNMGYQSIKALVELKKKNMTSTYVDTGVYGVTKENMEQYIKSQEKKESQVERR